MVKGLELPADVVGARTSVHTDQTRQEIGQPLYELSPRQLNAQHDGTALILANEMEGALA